MPQPAPSAPAAKRTAEVFSTFLKLGLTSFGGPVAHIGFFRAELVQRRQWLSESHFGQLLAICQFLPGPASSQLGFSLGLMRAGWPGALAAFLAFTLPSALLLVAFAAFLPYLSGPLGTAAIHGLKIVALAVVADGVMGMARKLCPDARTATIAALATSAVLLADTSLAQLLVVAGGAVAGMLLCQQGQDHSEDSLPMHYGVRTGGVLLAVFFALLLGLPLLAAGQTGLISVAQAFYSAGALVFGGGHVVLPLLEESVVGQGWVSQEQFLAGYGASQAIPGPMFSFSAYLGAVLPIGQGGIWGAVTALAFMFLPGFLLVAGILPMWRQLAQGQLAGRALAGVNAAVVGLLAAALYDPIFTNAAKEPVDIAIGLIAFVMLTAWHASALIVVTWCVLASMAVFALS
ncbi:MAG: chromate efflux transporter [Candidatus Latescibacteria bacterium]|nr:chromate efflux transporter [Candidatus Latescibacterota bacterium]